MIQSNPINWNIKKSLRVYFIDQIKTTSSSSFLAQKTFLSELEEAPVAHIEDYVLQLEVNEPPENILEIARNELRETPENQRTAIEELRKLLEGLFKRIFNN